MEVLVTVLSGKILVEYMRSPHIAFSSSKVTEVEGWLQKHGYHLVRPTHTPDDPSYGVSYHRLCGTWKRGEG